jgi:hypothetical protein
MTYRRELLTLLGAGVGGLAGCTSNSSSPPSTPPPTPPPSTATPTPLEQRHQAHNVETVVQQLSGDSYTLDIVPPEDAGDADYTDSNIYDYDGELTVEVDLEQAREQRHHGQLANDNEYVQEWVDNIMDEEWRTNLIEEAGFEQDQIDWGTYTDGSLNYRERMLESNLWALWYHFEDENMGGISSDNNEDKAAALQETESEVGFDTFIWDDGIPGHGLIHGIGHPAATQDGTTDQETYVIETDYNDSEQQQVARWSNSQYQTTGQHPAQDDIEEGEEDFYVRTAQGKNEAAFNGAYEISEDMIDGFIQMFNNPESTPAEHYLDPIAAVMYLIEESILDDVSTGEPNGSSISLTSSEIEYSVD